MTRDGSPVEKWLIKKEKNNADGFIRVVKERGRNHRVRNSFQLVELRKKFDNR